MSTSGTVATTTIDTALVIDHAVRRCGKTPSSLTPEDIETAKNNLYLILTSLSNRGVNLWCVEKQIVGLYLNQVSYTLDDGTLEVLNALYRTVTELSSTETVATANWQFLFSAATAVKTVGILFGNSGAYSLVFEYSADGISWTTVKTIGATTEVSGKWKWYDVDPAVSALYFRVRETVSGSVTFTDVIVANEIREVPISPMSRDTYTALPNKNFSGKPLQYFYNKQTTPAILLWPVPDNTEDSIVIWKQRQVQDIGSLVNKLEIPERWFEAVIWMLAKNLACELPSVPTEKITLCIGMADRALNEAEDSETDGAPIFIQPNISGYTR